MKIKKTLTYFIALIWLINGFFCKILNFIPRHQEIVERILNEEFSREITFIIGVLEVLMTIWILSGFKSKLNSIAQIAIVITMNIIEFILTEDLLLFGRLNILFALLFCSIIYYNEFILKRKVMFKSLKNHPFAVESFFESSIVFTFAVPKAALETLIPDCLTLDTFQDKWAFIAIAMVQTKDLKPKGFPKFMGNDFFLIGYRVFVRYTNSKGKSLRGLYILKSETDSKKMTFRGNIFTHYNYTTTDINIKSEKDKIEIFSRKSNFKIKVNKKDDEIDLPINSPFKNWKEARRFAGPLPFTFTYNEETKEVLIIEGVRQNWKPKPLKVEDYHFDFLDKLQLKNCVLANGFIIENIPYQWEKGKIELWK